MYHSWFCIKSETFKTCMCYMSDKIITLNKLGTYIKYIRTLDIKHSSKKLGWKKMKAQLIDSLGLLLFVSGWFFVVGFIFTKYYSKCAKTVKGIFFEVCVFKNHAFLFILSTTDYNQRYTVHVVQFLSWFTQNAFQSLYYMYFYMY